MASRGRGARAKGHNYERKIANLLTEKTGVKFKRGMRQSRSGGAEDPDVHSEEEPQWFFELKRHIKCNIKGAMRQAMEDIKARSDNPTPIIITKDDYGPELVTMHLEDWLPMWLAYREKEDVSV